MMTIVLGLLAVAGNCAASSQCVPLPNCEPILQMVKNKDSIANMTRADVFLTVRKALCGFEENTPKVLCKVEEGDELEIDLIRPRDGGGVIDMATGSECDGALKLHHRDPSSGDVGMLVLRKRQYSALRKLEERMVFNSQVDGRCCWKVNSGPYFVGLDYKMGLGGSGTPEVQPRAAKKISCTEI